jgi:hypothetical protein
MSLVSEPVSARPKIVSWRIRGVEKFLLYLWSLNGSCAIEGCRDLFIYLFIYMRSGLGLLVLVPRAFDGFLEIVESHQGSEGLYWGRREIG